MQAKGRRLDQIKKHSVFYLFLLPGVISAFIFNYIPMGGIIMAFQDYRPQDGWLQATRPHSTRPGADWRLGRGARYRCANAE